ncbi:hypothetical protein [Shimia sp.]|uniref:hypothetical protein n=1 Tax=Shimia sp. TaxID=1954381 RepID=UPI003297B268
MKPVVLLIGKLRQVIEKVPQQLDHLPVNWLGAHDHAEVMHQLNREPNIDCAIIGGSLPDDIRGDLVAMIATRRPDICIHVKDRDSGPDAMAGFVENIVRMQYVDHKLPA